MPTEPSELERKIAKAVWDGWQRVLDGTPETLAGIISEAGLADLEAHDHEVRLLAYEKGWVGNDGTAVGWLTHKFADLEARLEYVEKAKLGFIVELDEMNDKLEAVERERDEVLGVGPSMNAGPYENCTSCGRRMVWQRKPSHDSESLPGSWMCPNCVLLRVDRLKRKLDEARTKLKQIAVLSYYKMPGRPQINLAEIHNLATEGEKDEA